jgi:hypothetical protein
MRAQARTRLVIAPLLGAIGVIALAASGATAGKGVKTASDSESIGPVPDTASPTAKCKRGTQAVSGGFASDDLDLTGPGTTVVLPHTSAREGKREWNTTGLNLGDEGTTVTAYAYCRDENVKSRTASVTTEASPPPEPVSVTAKCKKGTKIVSGGWRAELDPSPPDFTYHAIADSHRVGKREWRVEATGLGNTPGELVAQANCREGKSLKKRSAEHTFPTSGALDEAVVQAKCKRSERVVSGGFSFAEPNDSVGHGVLYLTTSRKQGKRGWTVEAAGGGAAGTDPTLTVFAYCEKK